MPKNKIDDLRNHLFETMELLKAGEIDLEVAKGIAQVAQVIVNVTKLEVDFVKNVAGLGTGFIPVAIEEVERLRDSQFSKSSSGKQISEVNPSEEKPVLKVSASQKRIIEFLMERGGEGSRVGIINDTRYKTIQNLEILEAKGVVECVERPPEIKFSSEPVSDEASLYCGTWRLLKKPV